jgi:hypothetical protein
MAQHAYPDVVDRALVGTYPALSKAGGGFVWDAVLEYRVWVHPPSGGDDWYRAFASVDEAESFAGATRGAEEPLALIVQEEYLDEPEPGVYVHVKQRRVTEWALVFLHRPRRTARTIPDFFAPDAPPNRLDILHGRA